MKKLITVCIMCFFIILISYNLWMNPYILKSILSPIVEKVEEYTREEEIPYTTDFIINDIDIKNNDYYYNRLDLNNKAIYKSLANAVKELKTEFEIQDYEFETVEITMDDVEKTMHNFLLDHPEVFYLNDKYSIATTQSILGDKVTLKISYTVTTKEELDAKVLQIRNAVQEIINEANIGIGTTFEKELRLHDLLAKKVRYYEYENINQIPHNAHTIYGALVENTAVCDGMSKALQVLMDKINVESIVVTGNLDAEAHAWNMVKMNNQWYNVDMTSNKSIKEHENIVIHSYFNITTAEIQKTHSIDEPSLIPVANSLENNYFVVLDKIITANDNFDEKLSYILRNNNDLEKVEYKVQNVKEVPEKTIKLLRNERFYQYLDETLTRFVYYNILDDYVIIKR